MADDLEAAFIFVPHGNPPPLEWMKLHPDWIKIPALLVPHGTGEAERQQAIADFQTGRRFRMQVDDGPQDLVGAPFVRPRPEPPPSTDPGVVVHFPDGRPIPDPYGNHLYAPVSSLAEAAKEGRKTGELYRMLLGFRLYSDIPVNSAEGFLFGRLLRDVGHGGTFDYQRQGNYITGWTQIRQFRDVSNFDVGLYCQQAGLSLEDTLELAGTFASHLSSNRDPRKPHGLEDRTRELIQEGYAAGASGAFDISSGPGQ